MASLAVFEGPNQAFCAHAWCEPGHGDKASCDCRVFNGLGLAPGEALGTSSELVSTYDVVSGALQESPPSACYGRYIDCYGRPCSPDPRDQGRAVCDCVVRQGAFFTASSSCGPDPGTGALPNGAPVPPRGDTTATPNAVLRIIQAVEAARKAA